jgi:arginyl-tRNA synthetase
LVLDQDEQQAREALRESLRDLGKEPPATLDLRRIPFAGQWGLASSVCLRLTKDGAEPVATEGLSKKEARKQLEAAARERAQGLAEQVAASLRGRSLFADVQAQNGYVNMYFDTADVARRLLREVHDADAEYGSGAPKTETVMVEYGQLNTHKPGHVGHLRNLALGDSLSNILRHNGYSVLKATYIGDTGANVFKWLWGYCKFHDGEPLQADDGDWWERIYVEANRAIAANPEYDREYRELQLRWDQDDPEVMHLWGDTREVSLEYLRNLFGGLGVHFDVWFYESQFGDPGKQIVRELLDRGIAEIDDGAPIVRLDEKLGLDKETYRTVILQRSNGTPLYQTKELALTRAKFDGYPIDSALNVVDVRQTLYFRQVFKTLELLGYEQARKSAHVPYEYVTLATGPMSSREGNVVTYDDFAREMADRALATVREKNPEMPPEQQEEIARIVSIGAMKFGMLDRDNTKLLVFNLEEALDFDGFSAPYVQYAHARACSILRKAPAVDWENLRPPELSTVETDLLEAIGNFADAVDRAAREYKPLHVVTYAYHLARTFSEFYRESPVLRAEDDDLRNFRLALVYATKTTLANALRLLGIAAPEVM